MKHNWPFYTAMPLCAVLSACGNIAPQALNQPSVDVRKVLAEVQCALDYSISEYEKKSEKNKWIREWNVAFELTSDLTNTGEVGIATLDWTIPHSPNPFSLGLANKVVRANQDKVVYRYKVNFKHLRCPREQAGGRDGTIRESAEALGFDRIFETALWVQENSGGGGLPTFSYRRQFALTSESGAKPGFKITNLSGTLSGKLSRANINTLDMAFAATPAKEPVPHVIVDNLPGGRGRQGGARPDYDKLDQTLDNGLKSLRNEPDRY